MFKIGDEEEEEEGQQSAKAPSNSEGNSGTSTKNIRITRLTRIIKMLLVHSRYNTIIIIIRHTRNDTYPKGIVLLNRIEEYIYIKDFPII